MKRFTVEQIGTATLILGDCREAWPHVGPFDAIVTDPPYGIDFAGQPTRWQRRAGIEAKEWDAATVDDVVSGLPDLGLPCAIWGGNYYALPPSRGLIAWTKPDAVPSMAQVEFCWTNRDRNAAHVRQTISATNPERFTMRNAAGELIKHPTQKPIAVMLATLDFLSLPAGAIVFDPFMGSGTTGIACWRRGLRFIGCETDADYFAIACARIADAQRQADLLIAAL